MLLHLTQPKLLPKQRTLVSM